MNGTVDMINALIEQLNNGNLDGKTGELRDSQSRLTC